MALCVAAYHFASWTHAFTPGGTIKSAIAVLGIYSVQGFFIISGLCFFYVYDQRAFDRHEAARFYIKRFFRIAPLYYAALSLNLALGRAVWPAFSWRRIAENFSLSFGLFHPNHAMVLGGWSIGIECAFYLAFPLLLVLVRSRILLLVVTVLACVLPFLHAPTLLGLPEHARFHGYVQITNHAFLFLLGALAARLAAGTRVRLSALSLLVLLSLALLALLRSLPPVWDHFALMVGQARIVGVCGCFLLVLVCALAEVRRPAWFAPFRWLGEISYALYLLHPFAWLLLEQSALHASHPRLAFVLGLGMSLGLAGLVHVALERPLLRFGQRLSARVAARERESGRLHAQPLRLGLSANDDGERSAQT